MSTVDRPRIGIVGGGHRSQIGMLVAMLAATMGNSIDPRVMELEFEPHPYPRRPQINPHMRLLPGTPRKEHQNTKENARRLRQMEKLGRKP